MKRQFKKPRYLYANGGNIPYAAVGNSLSAMGQATMDGRPEQDEYMINGVLSGAGSGAEFGSAFGPWGTAVGAVVGGVYGGITGAASGKDAENAYAYQQRRMSLANARINQQQTNAYLQAYPTQGITASNRFAKGGRLPFQPAGQGVIEVMGNKHENGGVKLGGGVEVEGGEAIKGTKVFSDRLRVPGSRRTYAEEALRISKTPEYSRYARLQGKYLNRLQNPKLNEYQIGTATRFLQTMANPLDKLFNMQEQSNASKPGKIMADGGDINDQILEGIGNVAPYIDNITNAIITAKTPRIPVPTTLDAPRLQTQFNINPQLAAIERNAAARDQQLTNVSRNSSALRSSLIAGDVNDIYARNQLYGQKANVETDLKNKQAMLGYESNLRNAAMMDQYRMLNVQRQDDIHNRISANAANLTEDLQMQNRDRKLNERDRQELALTAMKYHNTGVLDRTQYQEVMNVIERGGTVQEALAILNTYKNKPGVAQRLGKKPMTPLTSPTQPKLSSFSTQSQYQTPFPSELLNTSRSDLKPSRPQITLPGEYQWAIPYR